MRTRVRCSPLHAKRARGRTPPSRPTTRRRTSGSRWDSALRDSVATGDSATFRLPDGRVIRLRELQVRPRTPRWNLAVGSMWFDLSGGQLVRAAYRMSVPMDIRSVAEEDDSTSFEDVPALVKPMIF